MSPIPIPKIAMNLEKDTPSKVEPAALKEELADIGLTCAHTEIDRLQKYIQDTTNKFPLGDVQGYGMFEYNPPAVEEWFEKGFTSKSIFQIAESLADVHNNWKPKDTSPYMPELSTVGYPEHFDYLLNNYKGFSGVKSSNKYEGENSTADAIRQQFTQLALNISSTLVDELDKEQLEAMFIKIIAPQTVPSEDYDSGIKNRNIYLVLGYNGKTCDGIGILNVEYRLQIKNYKEKKDTATQSSTLDVVVRTSLYNDTKTLENEVLAVQTHFKNKLFFGNKIPYAAEVEIYDALPGECKDTFIHSLPLEQTSDDKISVMVLYAPDLNDIGCVDNTGSDASTTYIPRQLLQVFHLHWEKKFPPALSFLPELCLQRQNLT